MRPWAVAGNRTNSDFTDKKLDYVVFGTGGFSAKWDTTHQLRLFTPPVARSSMAEDGPALFWCILGWYFSSGDRRKERVAPKCVFAVSKVDLRYR